MSLRQFIYERANSCCEYCQTSQLISGAQMHLEHIIPLAKGGKTIEANLCLACAWCNSFKGTQIEFLDVQSNKITRLFNPRLDRWGGHFEWDESGCLIMGQTPIGRVTVEALQMNNQYIVPSRSLWVEAGWHPPT